MNEERTESENNFKRNDFQKYVDRSCRKPEADVSNKKERMIRMEDEVLAIEYDYWYIQSPKGAFEKKGSTVT
jgi:hypothetical protein